MMKQTVALLAVFILICAVTAPALAQDVTPSPKLKAWEPVMGRWVNEEENRTSPDGAWTKAKSELTFEWMPGGFFFKLLGKGQLFGQDLTWVEIGGYDPHSDNIVSWGVDSAGGSGKVTSGGWSGSSLTVNWTNQRGDGEVITGRCLWKYSSDYKSVGATCDQFTDGEWWTFRKVKGKKVQ